MKKHLYVTLAMLATVALLLSACNDKAAVPADVDYWPWNWGNSTLEATLTRECAGLPAGSSVPVNGAQVPCPTTETTAPPPAAPVDLCADQINPAWGNLFAKNSLQEAVYEAWLANVAANGGAVYGASKCSLPVDSRVFGPDDEVTGSGPAQLVTDYRLSGIWHPSVDASYTLASGCTFQSQFSQGDAPVAVYRTPGTIRLTNNVSNGVSLVGQVTCP